MKKTLLPLLALVITLSSSAQEGGVVNAFDDLSRRGTVKEETSPMRQAATAAQMTALRTNTPAQGYFCFTEDRAQSTRMQDAIPAIWAERSADERTTFRGEAAPGEFYTYQVAVMPATIQGLKDVKLEFSDLKLTSPDGGTHKIAASDMRCFNLGGVDIHGQRFTKRVDISGGAVQPLWIGVEIPPQAQGTYSGTVRVVPANAKATDISIEITVSGDPLPNGGTDQGWRMARLQWLDSRTGSGTGPTAPYTPIKVEGRSVKYLGGKLTLGPGGLPESIYTSYTPQGTLSNDIKNEILKAPMQFVVETDAGIETLTPKKLSLKSASEGRAQWSATLSGKNIKAHVTGYMEFDGFVEFSIRVEALKDITIKDIRLEVPYASTSARYAMGMGRKGGFRSNDAPDFRWDTTLHQDAIWVGEVNSGLNLKFKDQNYKRPLVNVYYSLGRLNMPASWGNGSLGGVRIKENGETVNLTAFSGARTMTKGAELTYAVEMLITPVKPLDMANHVADRFFHSNSDLSANYIPRAKASGANYINIHHKKEIYPYINYPYYDESAADFKAFSERAKAEGIGTRAYYTTRELTVKIPEIWALRSLGPEVIHEGPGPKARTLIHSNGPNKWLNDNFGDHFIPAWYNAFNEGKYKGEMDLSVITTPDSRWNNYYLEGLGWMIRNFDLRGVYIDDSALDRETLKRARRLLDADSTRRQIDIHSWNHFNQWAGFANSLQMYADLLPYVDRAWMGEGFGADNKPDFWLVEMSGIPFGMMSETLDAHNIWRGMIYCMPPRLDWSGNPAPLWKLWDSIGMADAVMFGYWDSMVPVRTTCQDVPATVYKIGSNKALVVLANWTANDKNFKLDIDTALLGFTPSRATLPETEKLQTATDIDLSTTLTVGGNGGMFIMLEK